MMGQWRRGPGRGPVFPGGPPLVCPGWAVRMKEGKADVQGQGQDKHVGRTGGLAVKEYGGQMLLAAAAGLFVDVGASGTSSKRRWAGDPQARRERHEGISILGCPLDFG